MVEILKFTTAMNIIRTFALLAIVLLFLFLSITVNGQHRIIFTYDQNPELITDAGKDQALVSGDIITLGSPETATGGSEDFIYQWDPVEYLNDATSSNPKAKPHNPITYTLTVTESNGCIGRDTVIISIATQLPDNLILEQFDVFPNPTNGIINIRLKSDEILNSPEIFLLNNEGRILIHKKLPSDQYIEESLKLDLFSKGIYFIRLKETDNIATKKILLK